MVNYDVTIVGSGIAGLMTAKKASSLGIKTLLVEKSDRIAGGSSTRNEGWLHAGTYHATSIKDRKQSIQVATRTLYGHKQLRGYIPEAVEDPLIKAVCLVREDDYSEEILSRWNEAEVSYSELKASQFFDQMPNVIRDGVTRVFAVEDVSINTRILYSKLLHDARLNGADFLTQTVLKFNEDRTATLVSKNGQEKLQSRLFVYTSGYGSESILKDQLGLNLPLRYWKSHLLITPKLTDRGVFNLSPGEAALMNHRFCSIIGFNEDAYVVEEPNFDIDPSHVVSSLVALKRLVRIEEDLRYLPVSCIKIDVPEHLNISRSLNVNIFEPTPGHVFAFPGKMTETPYLVDVLMQIIFERLDDGKISFRPCDEAKSVIFCKEGIELHGDKIIKKHSSEEGARLEMAVAEIYSSSTIKSIRVPDYVGFFVRDKKPCLLMERVEGKTALGHSDLNLAERLIEDLALFHHMFSQSEYPEMASVLYRDAIPSNHIVTPTGSIVHIDFSSADRFVHAWDDVALLINHAWSNLENKDVNELVKMYFKLRHDFSTTPRFVDQLPLIPNNQTEDQRREYYVKSTRHMLATGFTQESLIKDFDDVDFINLRMEDFKIFDEFRTLRANFYKKKIWGNE